MQAAFGLGVTGPTSGALVLAGRHWSGAGPTTDRRISTFGERIAREVVLDDVLLDAFITPCSERIDLGDPASALAAGLQPLPRDLNEAITAMAESELVREGIDRVLAAPPLPARSQKAWREEMAFMDRLTSMGPVPGKRTWTREDLYDERLSRRH